MIDLESLRRATNSWVCINRGLLASAFGLVLGLAIAHSAVAQKTSSREPTLEQLPPGLYQVCVPTDPHPSGLQLGQCYRFEKNSSGQVAGIWFKPHTDGSVCVGGAVVGNRVDGRAISFLYDWDVPPTIADLQGGYQDGTGYFSSQSPTILDVTEPESDYAGYGATVLYREATLATDELELTDLNPEFSMDACLDALEATAG